MNNCPVIVLTGGPGGGKSTLIEELSHDPTSTGRFAAVPEAILTMGNVNISPQEKLFQHVMVQMQIAMEDGLARALGPDDRRIILCNRGSLDPLAYWLERGWLEEEFFTSTRTTYADHYQRYAAVIHLVTAADGAEHAYRRWPDDHRRETTEQAILLDNRLGKAWQDHPRYYRLDNNAVSWYEKSEKAKAIIRMYV
jgi:predicted ATPase